mmetsp:Transcript_89246/g.237217  ORF Transcript_89246/g.237217 Transcript_89246/m.237217 type:complete len:278 (+) Transcript_89246:897-1730(+)
MASNSSLCRSFSLRSSVFRLHSSSMMESFNSLSAISFCRTSAWCAKTASASSRFTCWILRSRTTTCSSRLRPSCLAFVSSMALRSAAERSCTLRRCLAASFSRPIPRSFSSFSWMSLRMACASFCFMSTSSICIVLFLASSFCRCCRALAACCCRMVSSFASRASRSSSAFCRRCEALSCSSCLFAWSSARKRFLAPSLRTRLTCSFSSSCVSSSLSSLARVAASILPPVYAGVMVLALVLSSTSSSSSASGVGSCARHRTFWPVLSWTKSKRSMTQ